MHSLIYFFFSLIFFTKPYHFQFIVESILKSQPPLALTSYMMQIWTVVECMEIIWFNLWYFWKKCYRGQCMKLILKWWTIIWSICSSSIMFNFEFGGVNNFDEFRSYKIPPVIISNSFNTVLLITRDTKGEFQQHEKSVRKYDKH